MTNRITTVLAVLVAVGAVLLFWLKRADMGPSRHDRNSDSPLATPEDPGRDPRPKGTVEQQPPTRAEWTEREIEDFFTGLLALHREAAKQTHGLQNLSRFRLEHIFLSREARLLALAHPLASGKLALGVLTSPQPSFEDKQIAIEIMKVLYAAGSKEAEAELYRLAFESSEDLSNSALEALYHADIEGAYRALYLSKAKSGNLTALSLVADWPDTTTISILEGLIATNAGADYPECSIRGEAREALEKLRLLSSADGDKQLLDIISGRSGRKDDWTVWAIRAAKRRALDGLAKQIRERLDEAEASHQSLPGSDGLTTSTERIGNDKYYDDLLVAYAELKGTLSAEEQTRLRTFGYACDPRQRLIELANKKQ